MNQPGNLLGGNDEAIYNIGAVSRLTDIPEATLRVWERRYGFPDSERTSGGHRLYSEREVMRLHWVKTRVDEGMQISQAIRALEMLETEGNSASQMLMPQLQETQDSALDTFLHRLINALFAHQVEEVDQVITEALSIYPMELVVLEIISPTFTAVGDAWLEGRISVATEHFATHRLRHYLMSWLWSGPPPYAVKPIVLAGAPDEWHEGSLLILGVLLRRLRWPVVYLGPAVPLADLANFVQALHPSIVVIVAMLEESVRAFAEWPQWMPEVPKSGTPIICYGGRIFSLQPEIANDVPGTFLGVTLHDGINNLVRMLNQINPLVR